ncbi:MAG: PIG-L family deacetylase, partial [Gemmatimonadaceae bacterium]
MKRAVVLALAVFVAAPRIVTAQADRERGAAALGELIRGLGVTARVLMIGAHPDDEDTQLITWLARGRGVETAYLSLTRGDGGQNLIGNELGEALGVIRTEELLAARRIDGGQQYFTRAYDFGFSKSAEETYRHWPKDSILRDVVTVVRAFRPHVIVSVFSGTPRDGHGHHQVAGLLAREAYEVAGDTVRMPTSINPSRLPPWTPLKFYRSARFAPAEATLRIDVGEYSPLVGRSYAEIAGESRSQHKSQGFGSLQRRGPVLDHLRLEVARGQTPTPSSEASLFDGIDTSWTRFRVSVTDPRARVALDSLPAAFAALRAAFEAFAPQKLIAPLTRVQVLLGAICPLARENACERIEPDSARRGLLRTFRDSDLSWSLYIARWRLRSTLRLASGVAAEATASREVWSVGSTARVATAFYNRWPDTVAVGGPWVADGRTPMPAISPTRYVPPGGVLRDTVDVGIDSVSQPAWLRQHRHGDLFATPATGGAENVALQLPLVHYTVDLGGHGFGTMVQVAEPVVHQFADPVRGEIRRPIAGAPAISVTVDHGVEYVRAGAPLDRILRVRVRSADAASRDVRVGVTLPAGLTSDAPARDVTVLPGGQRDVTVRLRGVLPAGRHRIAVLAESGGERYAQGYELIEYEHIRPQRIYRPAVLDVEAVDVRVPAGLRVAYVRGVGDNVAPAIEQLGIPVTLIDAAALPSLDPARTPVLVIGPRAYEANDTLVANAAAVLDFARRGGTVVVQYGQHEMTQPGIMPYPITLERRADRVT